MSNAAEGRLAAAATLSRTVLRPEVRRVIEDYERLDSEEARARYADHFLGRTAGVMDEIWPTFYELLKRVEDGALYRKPGYLAGDQTFDSFREYFEYRAGQPFAIWAEMESTYHYAQNYAPDLLKKAFAIARSAKERVTKGAQALAKAIRDEGLTINDNAGPLSQEEKANLVNNKISVTGGSGSRGAEYLTRRIARDRRDILDRMAAGDFPSVRAAAVEAGIAPHIQSVRMDDPDSAARTLRRYMPREALLRLAELIKEG